MMAGAESSCGSILRVGSVPALCLGQPAIGGAMKALSKDVLLEPALAQISIDSDLKVNQIRFKQLFI